MPNDEQKALPDFSVLTPDSVLNLLEDALGKRTSNLCRPLTSYINRVYEAELEDGTWVIAKFYRPGRWSRAALQDEQDFLFELGREEVPVIPPIAGRNGQFLQEHHGMFFALFPKKGGRTCDEPTTDQWLELGRLIARMHVVGSAHPAKDRITIDPRTSSETHLQFILDSGSIGRAVRPRYEATVRSILDLIAPLFDGVERIRIHGDCHPANIIYRPGESFTLIDFDDMAMGPAVQDLWMLLPAHIRQSLPELGLLLEGYEMFRSLERESLRLIEPLRAMRFIHFTAWCARQKADGGFARLAPGWGTEEFWKQEIHDLEQQKQEILDALKEPLPPL